MLRRFVQRRMGEGLRTALQGGVLRSVCCCDSKLRSTRSGVDLGLIEAWIFKIWSTFCHSIRSWLKAGGCSCAPTLLRCGTSVDEARDRTLKDAVEFRQAKMWIWEDLDGAAVKVGA
ncbi:hypothetical protein CASFOL_014473 [Castilleja foliolosa]|uniref:Uncharacterized protein n=1 Tax=Castilleja foliolosa TaxID=1961234 RepID=A0ABD3DMY6_9LAMI